MSSQVFGLVSGMDSGKLIEATLNAKRVPIAGLKRRRSAVSVQNSKVGSIISKAEALKEVLSKMETNKDLLALKSTVGDEDVLTVTANGNASPGSYDINITQLAKAAKVRATPTFGDRFDEVTAGTISITVDGGTAVDITVDEGEDLKSVVDKINGSGADVNASLIFDGSNYTLQVSNHDTGYSTTNASDALVITHTTTGSSGYAITFPTPDASNQAQNAAFTLDGLAITSTDNEVETALDGLNLNLVSVGTSSLVVGKDVDTTKENIQGFVDSYNDLMATIKREMTVTEGEDRNQKLAGEPFLARLKNDFQDIVTQEINGLNGNYQSLRMIGISTGKTSTLEIDSDDLDDALNQDINGVGDVFSFDTGGIAEALTTVIDLYTDGSESILKERQEAFTERLSNFDDRIERLEARIENLNQTLIKKYSALEQTMQALNQQSSALLGLVGAQQQ